jgi:hypothetical protein
VVSIAAAATVIALLSAGTAGASDTSLRQTMKENLPHERAIATLRFNPFLPGQPPVETVTGKVNYSVYDREVKEIVALTSRLNRLRASLIVTRQSLAADAASTSQGRIGRSLAIRGVGSFLRVIADTQAMMDVKAQMLRNAITDDARQDAACFNGTGPCAFPDRVRRNAALVARRDAAISAFGRDRDAGQALLAGARSRLG